MTPCEHDGLDFLSITLSPGEHLDTECADCGRTVRLELWAPEVDQ